MTRDFYEELIIILGMLFMLTIFTLFALTQLNPSESFRNQCESLGGAYWETQNVSCKTFNPYCASQCNLNNQTYNFYDGNLCTLDCKYKNDKWKEEGSKMRCAC